MRVVHEQIPDGTPGVRVKLARLRKLVDEAKADPSIRAIALRLVAGVPERDWTGELAAVSNYVRRLRYTRDPNGVELFTDPRLLAGAIERGSADAAGDCDDHVALGSALLESIGHRTRFRVGGFRTPGGEQWAHIWCEVLHPAMGTWTAVDDTAKMQPLGWSPASRFETTMADLGDLGSLRSAVKKVGKAIAKPVEKIAAPVTKPAARALAPVGSGLKRLAAPLAPVLAPVLNPRQLVSRPTRTVGRALTGIAHPIVGAQKSVGRLFTDTAKGGVRLTAPFWGTATNTVAPGSGVIVDRLAQAAGLVEPTGNPLVDVQNAGTIGAGAAGPLDALAGVPWWAWAGGAAVLVLFLSRRRRR